MELPCVGPDSIDIFSPQIIDGLAMIQQRLTQDTAQQEERPKTPEMISFCGSEIRAASEGTPPRWLECHCDAHNTNYYWGPDIEIERQLRRRIKVTLIDSEQVETEASQPYRPAASLLVGRQSGAATTKLTRDKRLVGRLNLANKLKGRRHLESKCLYKLEELVAEANGHLTATLWQMARADSKCLPAQLHEQRKPIRLERLQRPRRLASEDKLTSIESQDSGIGLAPTGPPERFASPVVEFKLHLTQLIDLRSNESLRRARNYSFDYLGALIQDNRLLNFRLDLAAKTQTEGTHSIGVHRLKSFARVECEQLRAQLRFEWLHECLFLAFDEVAPKPGRNKDSDHDFLPALDSTGPKPTGQKRQDKNRNKIFGGISRLRKKVVSMHCLDEHKFARHLNEVRINLMFTLREFFLTRALDKLYRTIESRFEFAANDGGSGGSGDSGGYVSATTNANSILLCVPVELMLNQSKCQVNVSVDDDNAPPHSSPHQIDYNEPKSIVRDTFDFIIDEIGRICSSLPGVLSVLEYQFGSDDKAPSDKLLFLGEDENLLGQTKAKVFSLIESKVQQFYLFIYGMRLVHDETELLKTSLARWIHEDHLRYMILLNKFQSNGISPAMVNAELDKFGFVSSEMDAIHDEQKLEVTDERLEELKFCSKQIRLIELMCNSLELGPGVGCWSRIQFGRLLELELDQARRALTKSLRKEQHLLVRFKQDELTKLTDLVRLQFDEIELGVDLEQAICDYLNERWQLKQISQHENLKAIEKQILLANTDEFLYDDTEDDGAKDDEAGEHAGGGGTCERTEDGAGLSQRRAPQEATDGERTSASAGVHGRATGEEGDDEDEEFLNVLVNMNLGQQQLLQEHQTGESATASQMLALQSGANISLAELKAQQHRRVLSLVECRLLVKKLDYLRQLLVSGGELSQLRADVEYLLCSGLIFLSEFTTSSVTHYDTQRHKQSEPLIEANLMQTIEEVAVCSSQFELMLEEASQRLRFARVKLNELMELKSNAISRLVLEFDQLMTELGAKKLAQLLSDDDFAPVTAHTLEGIQLRERQMNVTIIKQLDIIQEVCEWAKKLVLRRKYLYHQNSLLEREMRLLEVAAQIDKQLPGMGDIESSADCQGRREAALKLSGPRALILGLKWTKFAELSASFWTLAEQFETQQIKWLNSDFRRIEFESVKRLYAAFVRQLNRIRSSVEDSEFNETAQVAVVSAYEVLRENMSRLSERLVDFEQKYVPILRFLTNCYVNETHWAQLTDRLTSKFHSDQPINLDASNCASALQMLEHVDKIQTSWCNAQRRQSNTLHSIDLGFLISLLDELHRRATMDHQLDHLLRAENRVHPASQRDQNDMILNENLEDKDNLERRLSALVEASEKLDDGWSTDELITGANLFICSKLSALRANSNAASIGRLVDLTESRKLSRYIIECHLLIRQFLRVDGNVDLAFSQRATNEKIRRRDVILRSLNARHSVNSQRVSISSLLECLRLFVQMLLEKSERLSVTLHDTRKKLDQITEHLRDIKELTGRIGELNQGGSNDREQQSDIILTRTEQLICEYELTREQLTLKEAQMEQKRQQSYLRRNECIQDICQRAIPAVRAAKRALDCLDDGHSLRSLRSFRPSPPIAVRLVIEAVCILHNCSVNQVNYPYAPARRFDATSGRVIEDYWPMAWRTLNGLHSQVLLKNLRHLNVKSIPIRTMRFIRFRYLNQREFSNLSFLERVSFEAAQLARWLIATDIFYRVVQVVRPNYQRYMDSESELHRLVEEIRIKRLRIEELDVNLEELTETSQMIIRNESRVKNLLADCHFSSRSILMTRDELRSNQDKLRDRLARLEREQDKLIRNCLIRSVRRIYLDPLPSEQREIFRKLISTQIEVPVVLGESN